MPRPKKGQPPAVTMPVQINVRVTPEFEREVDRWTAEHNYKHGARMTRSGLIRDVIAWVIRTRPDWQAK